MKKLVTIMTLMTAMNTMTMTTAYIIMRTITETHGQNVKNLYDLPDYKATDNDDSGITVFFAPKAEKLTAMEKNTPRL